MKILVTGATGFIGQRLVQKLLHLGLTPVILTRNPKKAKTLLGELPEYYEWDSQSGAPPKASLDSVHAVVNLMGEELQKNGGVKPKKKDVEYPCNRNKTSR